MFGIHDIAIDGDSVVIGNIHFQLSNVIIASVNINTSIDDEIGGSAVIKTREFDALHGLVQKIYKGTFDKSSIELIIGLEDKIVAYGGGFKTHNFKDHVFRTVFF